MRQRATNIRLGYPPRPWVMSSVAALERISHSPQFFIPEGLENGVQTHTFESMERLLLGLGFQYIYAYDGNPKQAVRLHLCQLVEWNQIKNRFTFINQGFDIVGFDDLRDVVVFRMGDVHEEFLSNVPVS